MSLRRGGAVGANVTRRAFVALVAAATVAACTARGDAATDLAGRHGEVLAVWQDAEARSFTRVLRQFERDTGATLTYTSTGDRDLTEVLDERWASGAGPDVALLPQPALLERYARAGRLRPLDDLAGGDVAEHWAPIWRRLGTVDGHLYGVWFKAANKSLLWYSIGAFERAGVIPPDDLDRLPALADALAAAGTPAFSLTGTASDAWTLTDWFENLYLRLAGTERYDALAAHRLPWSDPSVIRTLEAMAALLSPAHVTRVAGPDTTFPQSVAAVFSPGPAAAMVMEGDFVPGVVAGETRGRVGIDVDVFAFPGRSPSDRLVVGAGDAAVLLRDTPVGRALLRYLASPEAAEVWARLGGFVSANEDVDLAAYPDATAREIARSLLEAGDSFRFDLSDLQPVGFGGETDSALWVELTAFLADPVDAAATAARLEAAATAAWSRG